MNSLHFIPSTPLDSSEPWSLMSVPPHGAQVGWPLATALVCLLDDEQYSQQRDITSDFFLRQLKSKEWRSLAVKCLVLLMTSLLVRYGKVRGMALCWQLPGRGQARALV